MKKDLEVAGYSARGGVKKVMDGYGVVIIIPFGEQGTAEYCLGCLSHLKEDTSGRTTEDN